MAHKGHRKSAGGQNAPRVSTSRSTHAGFGMALLMVFLASAVLMASSMSLILAPSVTGITGSASINNSEMQQVSQIALDAAQADILTKLQAGTTVDTSYRFPSSGTNTISIPSYPSSSHNLSIANYYVTLTATRGFTYLAKATITINNASIGISRLMQLARIPSAPSIGYAAYSLRRFVPGYAGYAVKVRCNSGTGQDIGFTASGNFDLASLQSCLGDSLLPLDIDSSAKMAYGLRKLKASYNGYAIKVRSSAAGSPTQDIGFDSNGNLDVIALKTFVGANSGYIDTWYDQSGNGKNLTQGTTSSQPTIVESGAINMQNNAPSIHFNNSLNQYLSTSISGYMNTSIVTSFLVGEVQSSSPDEGRIAVLQKTGDIDDYFATTSMQLLSQVYQHTDLLNDYSNGEGAQVSQPPNTLFQTATVKLSSGSPPISLYLNDSTYVGDHALQGGGNAANTINPDYLIVGAGRSGSTVTDFFAGYVNELIVYKTNLSTANRRTISRGEGHYYNIPALRDGFVMTWYDQSGNGLNLTQGTNGNQPSIDMTGTHPAVYFDGNQEFLDNTTANKSTSVITGFTVSQIDNPSDGSVPPIYGRIISVGKTGETTDWNSTTSMGLINKENDNIVNSRISHVLLTNNTTRGVDFQATAMFGGPSRIIREEQSSATYTSTSTSDTTGTLVINNIRIGAPFEASPQANEYWRGRINEVLIDAKTLTTSQYQNFETDEQTYYNVK